MAIDYSLFAIPKTRVKALDKADARKAIEKQDREENAKAKARARVRCEVRETWGTREFVRCVRRDVHTHHLIGGIGRRNRGKSILAAHKLRVCASCHRDIHAKVLQPTTATDEASKIRYRRMR